MGKEPKIEAVQVIYPYWSDDQGTWVFDDPTVGLHAEPFVKGIPGMIDWLVAGIPDAKKGFCLSFSAQPFQGWGKKLTLLCAENGGNWYETENPRMHGWLCPNLLCFFKEPPKVLYVRADPK